MVSGRLLPPDDRSLKWHDGRFELAMVSLNSNSETHINVRYDARLIYGRGGFHGYLYSSGSRGGLGGLNPPFTGCFLFFFVCQYMKIPMDLDPNPPPPPSKNSGPEPPL